MMGGLISDCSVASEQPRKGVLGARNNAERGFTGFFSRKRFQKRFVNQKK
jgi:hypothetical protein